MTIYLDFDGTVVEHEYPDMGTYNAGCFEVIRKLQDAGHDIILNTYRVDCNDGTLEEALHFLHAPDSILPVTEFTHTKLNPGYWNWPFFKANRLVFVDDACAGIPLKPTIIIPNGKMVDWDALDEEFRVNGLYGIEHRA